MLDSASSPLAPPCGRPDGCAQARKTTARDGSRQLLLHDGHHHRSQTTCTSGSTSRRAQAGGTTARRARAYWGGSALQGSKRDEEQGRIDPSIRGTHAKSATDSAGTHGHHTTFPQHTRPKRNLALEPHAQAALPKTASTTLLPLARACTSSLLRPRLHAFPTSTLASSR